MKIHNIQINVEKTKQKRSRHNTRKPKTNTSSKYCTHNTKKFDITYTHIIQGPYNKRQEKEIFHTYYESFLDVRNSQQKFPAYQGNIKNGAYF
jgi:hypothetical protein